LVWQTILDDRCSITECPTGERRPMAIEVETFTYKVNVNFEIYIADRKATTCIEAKLFLLRCVYPAALPLVRCYSIRLPRRVAS